MSMYSNSSSRPIDYAPTREVPLYKFFNQVYAWMFVGLALTGVVAYLSSTVPAIMQIFASKGVMIAAALGMAVLAMSAQGVAMRVSAGLGLALFLLYATLTGVMLSAIFLIYSIDMLAGAFMVTGGVFAGLSIVGFVLKKDLSGMGSILIMCVWGLFLGGIVNVFLQSSAFSWFITYAVLIVFIGLTVYETQRLKMIAEEFAHDPKMLNRAAVVGSITLYISFINLFLAILRIMGSRK